MFNCIQIIFLQIEDLGFPTGKPKHKIIIDECGQCTDN